MMGAYEATLSLVSWVHGTLGLGRLEGIVLCHATHVMTSPLLYTNSENSRNELNKRLNHTSCCSPTYSGNLLI